VIGPEGTDRVIARLKQLGFEIQRGLSSPEHLVLRRAAPPHGALNVSSAAISASP
jgi:hypothetical protein